MPGGAAGCQSRGGALSGMELRGRGAASRGREYSHTSGKGVQTFVGGISAFIRVPLVLAHSCESVTTKDAFETCYVYDTQQV